MLSIEKEPSNSTDQCRPLLLNCWSSWIHPSSRQGSHLVWAQPLARDLPRPPQMLSMRESTRKVCPCRRPLLPPLLLLLPLPLLLLPLLCSCCCCCCLPAPPFPMSIAPAIIPCEILLSTIIWGSSLSLSLLPQIPGYSLCPPLFVDLSLIHSYPAASANYRTLNAALYNTRLGLSISATPLTFHHHHHHPYPYLARTPVHTG